VDATDTSDDAAKSEQRSATDIAVGCAAIVVGALLLLLFISFLASIFSSSLHSVLSGAEHWAAIIANLLVTFVAFPAFRRTKDRAFLFLAVAALCFAYLSLFSLLLGINPPVRAPQRWSHTEAQLYYAMHSAVYIIGLASYAFGITLLARRVMR
jgi:hypothetical protein